MRSRRPPSSRLLARTMTIDGACWVLLGVMLITSIARRASADEKEERTQIDHTIVIGAGGAGELEPREGSFHPGANVFLEYVAIENWLELELGASLLAAERGVEVPVDLLLKQPFRLSRGVWFIAGLGPEIVHVTGTDRDGTFGGIGFALGFMFWPSQRFGLWVERS